MREVYGKTVFALGDTEYTWADILMAAALRGDWQQVVARARRGAALLAQAQEADEFPLSDEEIESAAEAFRYDRDLVTAEETEKWLARYDLDAEAWMTWVTADLLCGSAEQDPEEIELSPEDVAAVVHSEAVFSNALGRFAYQLAARAAISARLSEEAGGDASPDEGGGETVADPPGFDELLLVLELSPEKVRRRLADLARLERAYGDLRESVVTPENVEARVRMHQTDWMRVDARVLQLPAEDAAREALLSIREDGCDLGEVAEDANGELRSGVFYLETFEPEVRDHLLAARKGELLGPLRNGDGYALVLVAEKLLASKDDPEIAARAEESLLESAVSREVDNRVSWRWRK